MTPEEVKEGMQRIPGSRALRVVGTGIGTATWQGGHLDAEERQWAFTYRDPLSLGSTFDFRWMHQSNRVRVTTDGDEVIVFLQPRQGLVREPYPLASGVREGKPYQNLKLEPRQLLAPKPTMLREETWTEVRMGRRAIFDFHRYQVDDKGAHYATVVVEVIDAPPAAEQLYLPLDTPDDLPDPESFNGNVTRELIDRAIGFTNGSRWAARLPELAPWAFSRLIVSPDLMTKILLIKRPDLPEDYYRWAATYPRSFVQNPAWPFIYAQDPALNWLPRHDDLGIRSSLLAASAEVLGTMGSGD